MDDDFKEKEDEELEKGSDTDLVQSILADESGGLDALQQAIDQTQDPQLKEILEAIQEDETKHKAALEQWQEMAESGSEEEEPADDAGEPEAEEEPLAGEGEPEETNIESDADLEDEGLPEITDALAEEDGAGIGDKSDLIEDIRAVLEAHSDSEEGDDEGDLEKVGDVKTGDITLGKEGDEEEEDDLEKEDDEDEDDIIAEKCDNVKKAFRVPIIKAEADQQIVYGVVSEPDTIDLQGDRLSVGEIRKACHKFMQTSQRIGKEHSGPAKADIIESYIAPTNFTCNGQVVRKGSWVMAVKIQDPDLWQSVKKGDITGFSIAGTGTRIPFGE